MIDNNSVYEFVSFIINKNLKGSFTPKGYNLASKAANLELFDELRGGKYSTYQAGRPVPVVGMEQNRTLSEELDPFIIPGEFTVGETGIVDIPDGFVQWLGGWTSSTNKELVWVKKEDWPRVLGNAIDPPTVNFPSFTNSGKKWKFAPVSLGDIEVSYLKIPTTPEWKYTAVGNRATYNPTGTVHFEWNETAFVALASKILSYLGVNLSNDQVVGFAENMKEAK